MTTIIQLRADWDFCTKCGQIGHISTHVCPPLWKVGIDDFHDMDYSDDWYGVYAQTPKDAAEVGVEQWESAEYRHYIGEGTDTATVYVENTGSGKKHKFTVRGEVQYVYSAEEEES